MSYRYCCTYFIPLIILFDQNLFCTYFIPLMILFDQNLFLVRSKSCSGQKAVAIHSAAGNFVCLTCGKKLKRQRSLELHMRQHTGDKSYHVSPFIHCKYCTWCPPYTFEPVRITLIRIRVRLFTCMQIKMRLFTLMRIRIWLSEMMRVRIRNNDLNHCLYRKDANIYLQVDYNLNLHCTCLKKLSLFAVPVSEAVPKDSMPNIVIS